MKSALTTRVAQRRHRLNRVVNFVRENMAEPLSLGQMADVACLSPFHFLRAFQTYFGETPMRFLQRTRLEHAASLIAYRPDMRITDLALGMGFETSQTFSRAFHNRFGLAPRTFKQDNRWSIDFYANHGWLKDQTYVPSQHLRLPDIDAHTVRVETRPSYRLAYLRHQGAFGDVAGSISRTFDSLQEWMLSRGIERGTQTYVGVCSGSPELTPARNCHYDAGVHLDDDIKEDEVVSIRTVPGGLYAVLYVECPPPAINNKWRWLMSSWLPSSRHQCGIGPAYEVFHPAPNRPVQSDCGVELCLPLE